MADISDVLEALTKTVVAAMYPNGVSSPTDPAITGLPTLIYAGWPTGSQLDSDMAALGDGNDGRIHISLYPTATERNTTRYMRVPNIVHVVPATLTATVSGLAVTIGGTVTAPQNVAIVADGHAYLYAVKATDTLSGIAAALAAQITGAASAGAVVMLPATVRHLTAATGGAGSVGAITRNTQRVIQVTIWANTPENRRSTARALDAALAPMDFLTLPDGTAARMIYVSSHYDDMTQKANVYRRDLLYSFDFMTLEAFAATEVVAAGKQLGVQMPDGSVRTISTIYQ